MGRKAIGKLTTNMTGCMKLRFGAIFVQINTFQLSLHRSKHNHHNLAATRRLVMDLEVHGTYIKAGCTHTAAMHAPTVTDATANTSGSGDCLEVMQLLMLLYHSDLATLIF
jgi:hypothetical protein